MAFCPVAFCPGFVITLPYIKTLLCIKTLLYSKTLLHIKTLLYIKTEIKFNTLLNTLTILIVQTNVIVILNMYALKVYNVRIDSVYCVYCTLYCKSALFRHFLAVFPCTESYSTYIRLIGHGSEHYRSCFENYWASRSSRIIWLPW